MSEMWKIPKIDKPDIGKVMHHSYGVLARTAAP
jgi:hypothetical protein